VYNSGHFIIEWCHNLIEHFKNDGLYPAIDQIFSHFKTDITTAHNDRQTGFFFVYISLDSVRIRDISKIKNSVQVDTVEGWSYRFGPRRKNNLVVTFVIGFPCLEVFRLDLFFMGSMATTSVKILTSML